MIESTELADLLARGELGAAARRLSEAAGWPAGREVGGAELARCCESIAQLCHARGDAAAAERASAAALDPDNPDVLYDLGYALIDAALPDLAATVLSRCFAMVGAEEVLCELVAALEDTRRYRDAAEVLRAQPALRADSFLCRYLYAFNSIMAGELEPAREELAALMPRDDSEAEMAAVVVEMLARAQAVSGTSPLDGDDLRGWHYVVAGGLLLQRSPQRWAAMHGRYGVLVDSHARIAAGLERLAELVGAAQLPCVYAPPGRGNEILAAAAASWLGLAVTPWPAIGAPSPGLVVVYDLATLTGADIERLALRRPGQVLYAHVAPWPTDGMLAPDVLAATYETLVAPWQGDDATPCAAIAQAIVDSPGLASDDLAADDPAGLEALRARIWPLAPGPRGRLWAAGPVASERA